MRIVVSVEQVALRRGSATLVWFGPVPSDPVDEQGLSVLGAADDPGDVAAALGLERDAALDVERSLVWEPVDLSVII